MIKTQITKVYFIVFLMISGLGMEQLCGNIQAQSYFGKEAGAVFEEIYDFKMLSADSIVNDHLTIKHDTALWNLLSANVAWMEILAGNLESDYWNTQFRKRIGRAKKDLKESDLSKDDKLFYYIIVHAFKTRHELLNDNYINAASDLNTCIDQISESFGREEEYTPFYLTSGLYYYFMAKAYEDYILMRPYLMFYPDGDMDKGLEYLNRLTSHEDVFLRNESNYFLMRIYFDLEEDFEKAIKYADKLVSDNPENLIYQLYQIKILRRLNPEKGVAKELEFKQSTNSNNQLNKQQKAHFLKELYVEE